MSASTPADAADGPAGASTAVGPKVLIVTGDALGEKMAGPGIRAWQIALALSEHHPVELATTSRCSTSSPEFEVSHADAADLRRLEAWCDVLVVQGYALNDHPSLTESSKVMVVDLYDPFHLETLEHTRHLGARARDRIVRGAVDVVNHQCARGDFFLCASERQRDFWLGQLGALGRINPATYDHDETLRALLAVVPFGVPDRPPRTDARMLKGVVPGIGPDDKVVLWGGGIYNWLDPLTLVRAMDKLRARVPEARLFFLGLRHPQMPAMRAVAETKELAAALGLVGSSVFFNEDWVAYDEREGFLMDADVGVSTHLEHVETQFSFRTRVLDYLWAGLPVVTTRGGTLADRIEAAGAGIGVPPEDPDALEEALYVLLTDADARARAREGCERLAQDFRWSRVLEPLVAFCRAPTRAPDRPTGSEPGGALGGSAPGGAGMRRDLRTAVALVREREWGLLKEKVTHRLGRRRR